MARELNRIAHWLRQPAGAGLRAGGTLLLASLAACSGPFDPGTAPVGSVGTSAKANIFPEPSCAGCLIGPITVVRTNGAVRTQSWNFEADPTADYLLEINSSGGPGNVVEVELNGMPVKVSTGHGGHEAPAPVRIPVTLTERNDLSVRVYGAPGQYVTVAIHSGVKTLDEAGGTVRAPGGYWIEVPAQALESPTELQIIATAPPPIDPASVRFASSLVTVLPDGATFDAPLRLHIPYDPQVAVPQHLVAVQYLPSDNLLGWHEGTLDATNKEVILTLGHFSQYALIQAGVLQPSLNAYRYRLFGCPPLIGGQRDCGNFRYDLLVSFGQWKSSARSVGVQFAESSGASDIDIRFGTWSASYTDIFPGLSGWDSQTGHRTIVLNEGTTWWDINGFSSFASQNLSRVVSHLIGHLFGIPDQSALASVMGGVSPANPITLGCVDLGVMGSTYGVPALATRCVNSFSTLPYPTLGFPMSLAFVGSFFRARDVNGAPVEGAPVHAQFLTGGGSVYNRVMLTGPDGSVGNLIWRLGSTGGQTNTLQVFVPILPVPAVIYSVTTSNLPSFVTAPIPLAPVDHAVFSNLPRTVDLSWSVVPGATVYEVEVEACFVWHLSDFWTCEPSQLSFLSGFLLPPPGLTFTHVGAQPGRWHVRARDVNLTPGPWSPWRWFNFTQ